MLPARMLLWFTALACCAPGVSHAAVAPRGVEYARHKLFELALDADVVLAGTIVDVGDDEFELQVERRIVGDDLPPNVRVRKFVDWMCASRWASYAPGQRVLLFLMRPEKGSRAYSIVGGGGEGEMPLEGSEVVVRGYRVRGYAEPAGLLGEHSREGPRVALEEFAAAVRGLRAALAWQAARGGRWSVQRIEPRESIEAVEAFAASSRTARHLCAEARSSESWSGPRPPAGTRLAASALRSISARAWKSWGPAPLDPERDADESRSKPWTRLDHALAFVGDVDGDGIDDLVVGTHTRANRDSLHGALWILFLDEVGEIRSRTEIRTDIEGFQAGISAFTESGAALAAPGDLDGDGVPDLAVGLPRGPKPKLDRGSVWILFLKRDGSVARAVEIGASAALQATGFAEGGGLGSALANLGDLDGDGTIELAIGQEPDFDYAWERGPEVFLASIAHDGSVRSARRIAGRAQGFTGGGIGFGGALARIGDLDGDGVTELAVSVPDDHDGGEWRGAVWIAFLAPDGSVRAKQKISEWEGGFTGALTDWSRFGSSLAGPGDVDGDGVADLLVGSSSGVWTLLLARDGTVKAERKLENDRGLTGVIGSFGTALAVGRRHRGPAEELIPIACSGWHSPGTDDGSASRGLPADDTVIWWLALDRDGIFRAR